MTDNALAEFARHCTGENDPDYEVYEIDGGDLKVTLKEAGEVIQQLESSGVDFEVSFEASEPGDDFFEVVIVRVAK